MKGNDHIKVFHIQPSDPSVREPDTHMQKVRDRVSMSKRDNDSQPVAPRGGWYSFFTARPPDHH